MRILYVHQFFATRESDLGLIRSYEFSRRMLAEGHQVVMVTSSSRLPAEWSRKRFTPGEIDGIEVRAVRVSYSNYMGYLRRIWSFLEFMFGATYLAATAGPVDVVFATSTPLTVGIPGWAAATLKRVPFVFEVRDLWPEAAIQMGALKREGVLGRVAKGLERFLYHRSAQVVALSPGMVDGVVAEGVPAERVHMIPNCCDLDLFVPGDKDAEIVERLGLGDKFVVGYAGAVGPSNAVHKSVPQAAKLLKERGRDDIVFAIVGDGKCLPEMRRLKDEWQLDNLVLAGSMPKGEIPRFTRSADLLMTLFEDKPILYTNSPNKFFDGLATGKPMLVNSPGWTKDLVEHNECGVYVPPNDAEAMASAVIRLADDPALLERMGRNARALAEAQFDRDEQARRVLDVLQTAVGQARGR